MGAFKQFLSTDVTVVPFVVNKSFHFEGTASLSASGIFQYYGVNARYGSSQDITASTTKLKILQLNLKYYLLVI